MNQKKPQRSFFKKKQVKAMIVWYIILLTGILILAWKMQDIISLFGV